MMITLGFILILFIISAYIALAIYDKTRESDLGDNSLLLNYRTLETDLITEEEFQEILYKDYKFPDEGRVIENYYNDQLTSIVIRDDKHGFIKQYQGKVLHRIHDLRKAELIEKISKAVNPLWWFGLDNESSQTFRDKVIRSEEECIELGKLLDDKGLSTVEELKGIQIIIDQQGNYYIN